LQPDTALKSLRREKLALQAYTGWLTEALPGHEHDGLQQSQYRVDTPLPLAA
jgi:hypothetical protein